MQMRSLKKQQTGISLVELMVSMLIGIATIGVAMAALLHIRALSGVSVDHSELSTQASHILRMIGEQTRQAGSIRLDIGSQINKNEDGKYLTKPSIYDDVTLLAPKSNDRNPISSDNNHPIILTQQSYPEYSSTADASDLLMSFNISDCHGDNNGLGTITSAFRLQNNNLICHGSNGTEHVIAQNIADFQINYFIQKDSNLAQPKIIKTNTISSAEENDVYAIEVCLTIFGKTTAELPRDTTFPTCSLTNAGTPATFNVHAPEIPAIRNDKIHTTLRNTFQIRSQGLTEIY